MPPRGLPGNANLERLSSGATAFRDAVRAGDEGAADVVREFHPGSPDLAAFSLADAQLVVARSFDFPSWSRLAAYLETTAGYARSPHEVPECASPADEFLRLACLNYGADDPARWEAAAALLAGDPGLARASIHAAAAAGDLAAARELLSEDPRRAGLEGGPYRWEPLVYVTYSRVPSPDAVAVARLLLEHGADPNAGYLWEGLSPPFTALTGVFGSGEGAPPAHPDCDALARVLLEAGADPNDAQTLYNRNWDPDRAWLELLFEFGLGSGDGGPWHRLLVPAHPSPQKMLEEQLVAVAHHGFAGHVQLLLAHGVDPEAPLACHPVHEGRTPSEEAAVWGEPEVVALLADAGATSGHDALHAFLCAATVGDRNEVTRLLSGDPGLAARARAYSPTQVVRAAEKERVAAVELLIELGFDVNAIGRTAALHEAAMRGNLELIELLLANGADPDARDRSFDATPAGWAEHHGQTAAAARLCEPHDLGAKDTS